MEATSGGRGWRDEAVCRGMGPTLFFTEDEPSRLAAIAVCLGCPVRDRCLAEALHRTEYGIWGGTTEDQRRRRRRLRRPA